MERRLVKIVGKKDVPGKPMLYGTSADFLQYFGLKDLSSLPTLKEFQELDAGEEAMLPAEAGGEPGAEAPGSGSADHAAGTPRTDDAEAGTDGAGTGEPVAAEATEHQ
jgi:segregation and condensation protein B